MADWCVRSHQEEKEEESAHARGRGAGGCEGSEGECGVSGG